MKPELKAREVLAMYDVRGIQNYIFRSNYLQEIIGASKLVENIIIRGLEHAIKDMPDRDKFLTHWEKDDGTEYESDSSVQMQVLFIGGGNAYVLFRTGELCSKVNRSMGKFVLDKTYSLNLAIAVVEKTDRYDHDYQEIQKEMRKIKAVMPETKPLGVMPFMEADNITGFPISCFDPSRKEYLCTESRKKRESFQKAPDIKERAEKILDNMVTGKGDNSMLALVHIDGNSMGSRLMEIMRDKKTYADAVKAMREISFNIDYSFKECFEIMENYINEISNKIKKDSKNKLIRKIVLAGDDITFICNAKVAVGAVEVFLRETANHLMFNRSDTTDANYEKYVLSACGGIVFFNSHFPFSDAYRVAESCCGSAKKRAKLAANKSVSGNIGCYFDYQICGHIKAENLEEYREANYGVPDSKNLIIFRPYYVHIDRNESVIKELNEKNEEYNSTQLIDMIRYFQNEGNLPRSQAKRLRNSLGTGMTETDKYIKFLESRQRVLKEDKRNIWYDALEIMDITYVNPGKEKVDADKD